MLFLLLVLALLSSTENVIATSLPSLSQAIEACTVANASTGTCVPYPSTGICARFFPNNASVYLPANTSLEDIENDVIHYIQTANSDEEILTASCLPYANALTCNTRFLNCENGSNPLEALPILPCTSLCSDFWTNCSVAQKLNFETGLNGDVNASQVPYCFPPGNFDGSYAKTQPVDTWGGRVIAGWIPTILGLLGEPLMPEGVYNYTYVNGSKVQLQCLNIDSNQTAVYVIPEVVCVEPLIIDSTGYNCVLPCPFPVFASDVQYDVQAAFVGPAALGVLLCFVVFVDALWQIRTVYGAKCLRMWKQRNMKWSSSKEDSISAAQKSPKHAELGVSPKRQSVRVSTWYALLGSLLGIAYFLIGPLATIMYGSEVSCGQATVNLQALALGVFPPDPTVCKTQRASPFLLQAIFNLILYSCAKVFLAIDEWAKRLSAVSLLRLDRFLRLYCVGLPILTLGLGLGLDSFSTAVDIASIQLSRQATVCQVRLTSSVEWVLVFLPFIMTGTLVVLLDLVIFIKVKRVRDATAMTKAQKTATDIQLELLMLRLAVLGLATFATLVVVIISTTLYSQELMAYSPAFSLYLTCLIERSSCVDCSIWSTIANNAKPSPGSLGVQLFAESFIVVLFGVFFAGQTASRWYKECHTARPIDTTGVNSGYEVQNTVVQSTIGEDGSASVTDSVRMQLDKRVAPAAAYMKE